MSGEAPIGSWPELHGIGIGRRFHDPPTGEDETTRERWDYVSALRRANDAAYRPW